MKKDSPFEPDRNPFVGITQAEMDHARQRIKERDRVFEKRVKKVMKKLKKR